MFSLGDLKSVDPGKSMRPKAHCAFELTAALLFLAIVGGVGCNGSSPTGPDQDSTGFVMISAKQSSWDETMRRVQILFDDKVIRDYSSSQAFSDIIFQGAIAPSTGQHKVEFRIIDQVPASTSYKVSGSVTIVSLNGDQHDITLPGKVVTLSKNQGITWTVTI